MRAVAFAAFATVLLAVAAASRTPAQPAARPGRTAAPAPAPAVARPRVEPRQLAGWAVYDRHCLACHGAAGDGRGPAAPYTWAAPRDFTSGVYKWRSTPVGQPPSDDDLRAAILYGAPGTSMPAFDGVLPAADIANLVELVKSFAPGAFDAKTNPVVLGTSPPSRDARRGGELWSQHGCTSCHGADGRGTGGLARRPYDLTALPVRRPRATDSNDARRRALAHSIATGIAGTSMPGFAGALPDEDLWALADHVLAIGARAQRTDRSALDATSIDADRTAKLVTGTWPGAGDSAEAAVFGEPLRPQGTPPSSLAPAQASLRARQCARCHAKQEREWRGSVHAAASVWGLPARELDHAAGDEGACDRCHTPLAEQQASAASFDAELRAEGVTCAGCHVRDWQRRGPPRRAPSLLPATGYPLAELAIYERSDFCMACHQLPPRGAVNGKPLLNTYKEWLESPYMARGVQCQHCHMPNREHSWLGVHDRATFRQGIRLDARSHRRDPAGAVTVVATLTNIGAGHYLPTTPTPAVWLRVELVDGSGTPIPGARAEHRIGRDIESTASGWKEHADTRIPPGEHVTLARAWSGGRTSDARAARITIEVAPDDFYERLYARRLRAKLPANTRAAYEAQLARAKAAHYVAEQLDVPVVPAQPGR